MRVAEKLRQLFEKAYGTPDTTTEITLDSYKAMAYAHITLADLRRIDQ